MPHAPQLTRACPTRTMRIAPQAGTLACFLDLWHEVHASRTFDCGDFGDVLGAVIVQRLNAHDDALARHLVDRAQGGDQECAYVLMVALQPGAAGLVRNAAELQRTSMRNAWDMAVSQLWLSIHTLSAESTRSVMAAIVLNARNALSGDRAGSRRRGTKAVRAHGYADYSLEELEETFGSISPFAKDEELVRAAPRAAEELGEVIDWALADGVLTTEDVRILATYELGDRDDVAGLAAQLGVAPDSVRRRSLRIRNRLRDAMAEHIRTVGRW